MGQEQSIDDILKLLKESIQEDASTKKNTNKKGKKTESLSDDALQAQLRKQYGEEAASKETESDPYALDDDFLKEVLSEDKRVSVTPKAKKMPKQAKPKAPEKTAEIFPHESNDAVPQDESPRESLKDELVFTEAMVEDLAPWETPEEVDPVRVNTEEIVTEPREERLASTTLVVSKESEVPEEETVIPEECAVSFDEEMGKLDNPSEMESEHEELVIEEIAKDASRDSLILWNESSETFPEEATDGEPKVDSYEGFDVTERAVGLELQKWDEEETVEYQEFPEIETIGLSEVLHDYEAAASVDETAELVSDDSDSDVILDSKVSHVTEEQIQDSVFDLMLQFGCEEEIEDISQISETEDVFKDPEKKTLSEQEKQARRYDQTEKICREYQHRKNKSILHLLLTLALTVAVFFYDTLPLFEVEFGGIFNYSEYPGAYMMIGFQLVLLCVLCIGAPLWSGLKKIVTLRPDLYSVVALMVIATFAYDLTMILNPSNSLPPMFHFLTVLMMLSLEIGECALLSREIKIFSVYTTASGKGQYTLTQSDGQNSIAEQIHNTAKNAKKIYFPISVEEPSGFSRSIREEGFGSRLIAIIMFPIIMIAITVAIVAMLLSQSVQITVLTMMTVLFAALPLNAVLAICVPLCMSASRLQKRGIGLTSKRMIDRYAKSEMLVYHDLHLFHKCSTADTGIVFYEQEQTAVILGCLERLYNKIGGPLSDVFADIPESCRFERVRVRRIFRNGIEAFVDRKHILLVGDASFMRRYGMSFPQGEERKGRATLCISVDGKISAKMSVKYTVEPIFEMLTERLAQEGIQVMVETYDPLIQASFVASVRQLGHSPISVFHKNVSYLHRKEKSTLGNRDGEVGLLVSSSRLKLAEAVVWCNKLLSLRWWNNFTTCCFSVLGVLLTVLALALGWIPMINQYWLLLFSVFPHIAILTLTAKLVPQKDYFTVRSCEEDLLYTKQKTYKTNAKKKEKKTNESKHQ